MLLTYMLTHNDYVNWQFIFKTSLSFNEISYIIWRLSYSNIYLQSLHLF
jgi:hypothetical protein